jgi:hypothetical protein
VSQLYQNRVVLRWALFALTVVTAVVHLVVGLQMQAAGEAERSLLMILNGMGYFALLTAIALGELRHIQRQIFLYYALGVYTLVTFVLYFVLNGMAGFGAAAIVSKCAELLSVVVVGLYIFAPGDRARRKKTRGR